MAVSINQSLIFHIYVFTYLLLASLVHQKLVQPFINSELIRKEQIEIKNAYSADK